MVVGYKIKAFCTFLGKGHVLTHGTEIVAQMELARWLHATEDAAWLTGNSRRTHNGPHRLKPVMESVVESGVAAESEVGACLKHPSVLNISSSRLRTGPPTVESSHD